MLQDIIKKFVRQINKNKYNKNRDIQDPQMISMDLKHNLNSIKKYFDNATDIVIREFELGIEQQVKAFLVMVDGLADKTAVNESLLKSLMLNARVSEPNQHIDKNNIYYFVKNCALSIASVKETNNLNDSVDCILSGEVAIFIDGSASAIIASIPGWESRGVTEPVTETVVRGPREGFTETLRVNTSLLRRKIKNHNLKFEMLVIGKQTKTNVCITYVKGIANHKIVKEVKERLKKINTDSILESGYIESFIEDAPFSVFPTIGNTEKPDIVCAKILEGRVAILVDGTPFVLTVPYLFVEGFQNSEDYYSRPYFASFIRLLRWISFFIAISTPAIYIAITTYHQELLPPALLVTIAAAEEATPFPIFIEALIMLIMFEILREAGVRLPKAVGQAVSIVGALVIGEAAVSAGLIGAPMIIVVAITAITSFVITPFSDAIAIIRIFLIILAGIAGQYGIMLGVAALLTHICSLRSFGAPYMSPIAPLKTSDMKDTFIRVPWWAMLTRPFVIGMNNRTRQKKKQKPNPSKDTNKKGETND